MKLHGNWNIDREPTRKERVAAILLGLLICILTGSISCTGIIMSMEGENIFIELSVFYALFLLSLWVLVRAIFSNSAKPSATAIMAVGVFFIAAGIMIRLIPSSNAYSSYYVFGGIVGGSTIFAQGYRKLKKP